MGKQKPKSENIVNELLNFDCVIWIENIFSLCINIKRV